MNDIENAFANVGAAIGGFMFSAPFALRMPTNGAPTDGDAAARLGAVIGAAIGRSVGRAVDEAQDLHAP